MQASEAGASKYIREGRIPRLWETAVLWGLALALYLTAKDLVAFHRCLGSDAHFHPRLLAWHLYFWVQLANKLPVSYRYSPRGASAAADIFGFIAGMTSVVLFGLQIPVEAQTAIALAGCVAAWVIFGVFYALFRAEPGGSFPRRGYCALVAFVIPGLPMLGAALALAAA